VRAAARLDFARTLKNNRQETDIMAIITRVSRLFRADLHAVLDRIEEPGVLLRQAIREMEDEQGQDEQRLRAQHEEFGQLRTRDADLERAQADIEDELDVCFEAGEDDLARKLVRRRLEAQRLRQVLGRKREALAHAIENLSSRISENRTRIESMQQKADLLIEDESAPYGANGPDMPDVTVRDEDVEVAFLREKQARRAS